MGGVESLGGAPHVGRSDACACIVIGDCCVEYAMKIVAMVVLVSLCACAAGEPLPPIEGPWYQLNSDRWQPTEAELQQMKGLPEK